MSLVQALLKSVASILEDGDCDRGEMLKATFAQYRAATGRDGLADIAAIRKGSQPMDSVQKGEFAMTALEGLAALLRKREPGLTEAQAFAKVYEDPANTMLTQAERGGAYERLEKGFPAIALTEPRTLTSREAANADLFADSAHAKIMALAEEIRRSSPFLSPEQAYAKVYAANPKLAGREREEAYRRFAPDGVRFVEAAR